MLAKTRAKVEFEILFDKLDDVKAEGLINKNAKDLAEGEDETQGNVKAEALVEWLVNTLADVKAESLSIKRGDFEAVALVSTLPHTLAKVKAEKIGHTLGQVEDEALLRTLADTPAKVNAEKPGDNLNDVEAETLVQSLQCNAMGDVHLSLVPVDTLADTEDGDRLRHPTRCRSRGNGRQTRCQAISSRHL